ncbi:hypothetical protein HS041_03505 [Planomonospora sp. ID67723]|uniref:hypothetical protein n=1 Tax=Planomonospora sp. ID67723 TaxID=2738134 RepID=UPI0018C40970|nr:hypothetical protein [Planomonospora sp. ID67723]MBG0826839.1 hypothetical protein [Planomonospora sp. ID67723]
MDRVLQAEGERRQAEEKAFYVAAERACAAHPRHRPKTRPVRQARATMWTEFWTIGAWDEGQEGAEVSDRVADLVGGGDGVLEVWAADDIDAPDGTVQLLIMVFPGGERKPVIYR